MNEFLQFLPTALVALGSFGFGWVIGVARGKAAMRPCTLCGTTNNPRGHFGLTETWRCRDRDGCESRAADVEFQGAFKEILKKGVVDLGDGRKPRPTR